MLKTLRQLLGGPRSASAPVTVATPVERVPVAMAWRAGTTVPIPDWEAMHAVTPEGDDARRHAYWRSAAWGWLEALSERSGGGYTIRESADFLLLSALPPRQSELFLAFCQRVLRRVRANLAELADDGGHGPHLAIVFADEDAYYDYVSHYYPEGGEYAMSSGMFIQDGYGHFVMPQGELGMMEPVIAHELTHSLLSHLPIPAWLNEGLAVNTEHAIFPEMADPRTQLFSPRELAAQHVRYWDDAGVQAFWSGKSFLRTDDGNRLSYDLAARITALAARDEAAFRAFVAHAHMDDGGLSAEHHLGYPVANLVEAVLGEGPWQPRPAEWREGVERGQFRRARS
ncbi:hypothetical protein E2F46_08780 [Luteimonas aestuarii]|uniref:DUF1570 domain-containing protein n=1 Tax=Luteimonas aestuarii TaxID=453837 RepID=A0A4V3ALT9_9GAMM|nr:hypothetical protein [Luteimonas aestuarii]TDK24367.1 hypothetical protein E2F46_08780 [Luteimonas aestuarii]